MQLRPSAPEIGGLYSFSLLQDGYSMQASATRLDTVTVADIAHVGADRAGRFWDAVVAAARRGGERVVERRTQEAMRYIRRVRVQCGYGADSSPDHVSDLGRI